MIVMARQSFPNSAALPVAVLAALLALAIAALSYQFIERPITHGEWRQAFSGPRLVVWSGLAMSTVAAVGVVTVAGADRSWGARDATRPGAAGVAYEDCHAKAPIDVGLCTFRVTSSERRGTIVLTGDSYAAALTDGVIAAATPLGYDVVSLSHPGCPAVDVDFSGYDSVCLATRSQAAQLIAKDASLVIMAHNALAYVPSEYSAGDWAAAVSETVSGLDRAGIPVVWIATVPSVVEGHEDPTLLDVILDRPGESRETWERRAAVFQPAEDAALLDTLVVRPDQVLCASGRCRRYADDGTPYYFDYGHLTPDGAFLIAPSITEAIAQALHLPIAALVDAH